MEIHRIGNKKCWIKKIDFRSGCWLIGGRPKKLLILGDHLFLNYKKKIGQLLLINREGIINPHLTLYPILYHVLMGLYHRSHSQSHSASQIWEMSPQHPQLQISERSYGFPSHVWWHRRVSTIWLHSQHIHTISIYITFFASQIL